MTKTQFIAAYRAYVIANYAWAADTARLDRFMSSVETTLTTNRTIWLWTGAGSKTAWREIGGKGKPTLKALRALPA